MKTCSKCRSVKSYDEFSRRTKSSDGYDSSCKVCNARRDKEYREANKEKVAAKKKEWTEANKEYVTTAKQEDYERNKEAYLARARKSADNRKKERAQYMKEYYNANKEAMDSAFKESGRKRRAKAAEVCEKYSRNDEHTTKEAFNYQCFNCSATENLAIDHHIPLSFGAPLTVYNAVLLCRSYNSRKGAKLPQQFYTVDQLYTLSQIFKEIQCNEKKM